MLCPNCSTENPEGKKFCGKCGSSLAISCAACGSPNPPDNGFCDDCGVTLGAGLQPAASPPVVREIAAERRLVSVLFADLVGFTTLSESRGTRDPQAESDFATAEDLFRTLGTPFYLAVTQLEHAESLLEQGQRGEAEPLLAEARETFERLEAKPWLERTAQASQTGGCQPEAVTARGHSTASR
jgi:hypothetical protein